MKQFFFAVLFFVGTLQAAQITNVQYDAATDELVIDLIYGGCNLEEFQLEYGPCFETYPAQIKATLTDRNDVCRAIIPTQIRRSLSNMGCRPAYMMVTDSRGLTRKSVFIPSDK
jgi:hypothetical protein